MDYVKKNALLLVLIGITLFSHIQTQSKLETISVNLAVVYTELNHKLSR